MHGVDRLFLDNAIVSALSLGGVSEANVREVGTGAQDANDFILYNPINGGVYYDADANGAGASILFARLTPGTTLTATDLRVT